MTTKISLVWKYFDQQNDFFVMCVICKKQLSRKGRGTSSLWNHLKALHKDVYIELSEEQTIQTREKERIAEQTPLAKPKVGKKKKIEQDFFRSGQIWDVNSSESKARDRIIAEMFVMDDLPFSHVEDIGFVRLMTEMCPEYTLKDRNFYSSMVCNEMYESAFLQLKSIVDEIQCDCDIAFTTDVWSDTSAGFSLLSLSAHAITKEFERVNYLLSAEPLQERHTGEYISLKFDEMLEKWGIPSRAVHCVLRDPGANMKKAVFLSGLDNVDCIIHKVQQVVKHGIASKKEMGDVIRKCRSIATYFHHSTMAQDELKKIQDQRQEPLLLVIHDSSSRWNSTLHMLERIQKMKESLCIYVATHNSKIEPISDREWKLLSKCVMALKPYEEITKQLSSSSSSISDVIPLIVSLKIALQTSTREILPAQRTSAMSDSEEFKDHSNESIDKDETETTNIIHLMKVAMREALDKQFADVESHNIYRLATYLDPRYKDKFFTSSNILDEVQSVIINLCNGDGELEDEPTKKRQRVDLCDSHAEIPSNCSVLEAMNLILSSGDDENDETSFPSYKEIKMYHTEKIIKGTNEDTLKWWDEKRNNYPNLLKVVRSYLCCPPSSVPNAALIYDEKRKRLSADKVQKILFLKKNLPLLKFKY
ncbi:zinc finger BED domain-containing protein 4 [Lepeophtheirus salmonis]|uniref:zinc finger BED domain-containing protein 4 n=1 Tax=Lepeophtheirus salmonis TaxID=72036 RepID=UPI001AEB94D2|nr:zinc finger BED domain-containing protein 4-like [Lepeophtheirus salmonis]XP_040580766.1 zinc finger BED domain-containing protein 4-like [Lepeophtheirus salmonis]XP_040580767.1 zinc finger BED domain-containing protein 4-like [Lepeophtheirus salmonis]